MHLRNWPAISLVFLAAVNGAWTTSERSARADDLSSLNGEWIYVEDLTEGRPSVKQGPPMSPKLVLKVEKDALVHLRPRGDIRIALDGSETKVTRNGSTTRFRGNWKDGAFRYETDVVREEDDSQVSIIKREFRCTSDGLLVRVTLGSTDQLLGVAVYRHPGDIALPEPAEATIVDMAWLAAPWVGATGTRSMEERWTSPLGGAMLGVSRTVASGRMVAFEYLRIVERDEGLVYVAQPGDVLPTTYVLTELDTRHAVFENPRHDYPQRIVYELTNEGALTASIGFARGGRPRRFDFQREGK